ncbi:MAG: glycosyltransferase family 2 protein [Clostridium sp.]
MITINISACVICKNEEKNIERMLNSINGIVDEIVIVDTGSTDRTLDIIKGFKAKVIQANWKEDFSEARNLSLDNATGEYVLIIDCDECIHIDSLNKIKEELTLNPEKEGAYLRIINMSKGKRFENFPALRVFKNRKEYRFRGRIHERISSVIDRDKFLKSNCEILHYGYNMNVKKDKNTRNLDILKSYKDEDKDSYYYFALGNEYSRQHDFSNTLKNYGNSLSLSKGLKDLHYPMLSLYICKFLHRSKNFKECLYYINFFLNSMADFKDLYFIKTLCHIEEGNLEEGRGSFIEYKNGMNHNYYYPITYYEEFMNLSKIEEILNKRD